VIAGIAIASGLDTEVGALSIAYVLVLAVAGPVAARISEPIAERLFVKASREAVRWRSTELGTQVATAGTRGLPTWAFRGEGSG